MRRAFIFLGATLLAVGCGGNRERRDDGVEVTLDQLPPAVRDAFSRESGGAPIGKIERGGGKGRTVYEATMTKGATTWEIEVDESGKVLGREKAKGNDRED